MPKSWVTKVGVVIGLIPQLTNLVGNGLNGHDAISENIAIKLVTIGGLIAAFGLGRKLDRLNK